MTNTSLVDSNILIYAHDDDSPFFQKSYDFLLQSVGQKKICFALQNYLEAYRIFTQKLVKSLTVDEAWQVLNYYHSMDVPMLVPTAETFEVLERLTKKYNRKGVNIFDAQLVALMIENEIDTIYTANVRDFSMYKEIKAINIFE